MNEYDMQDEVTRRKIFWLLQRLTSLSLWKAKQNAFGVFAAAYETAVKTWPQTDPEPLSADHLKTVYEILSLYDEGLNELASGHRFVWREGQALNRVIDRFNYLAKYFYTNPKYWERGGQIEPYPPKVDALARLMHASEVQMEYAPLEVWGTDYNFAYLQLPEALLDRDAYKHTFYELAYPTFPADLPEVPNPAGPVIQSGQVVPSDGIWEPVTIEQSRVSGVIPLGAKLFGNSGCFNYFVADTEAPNLEGFDSATFSATIVPTHWRLLWEDTRYSNGVIPDESQYFLDADKPTEPSNRGIVEPVRTGDICPVSGEWGTEEYGGKTVHIKQGAAMPDLLAKDNLGERKVHWVTWRLIRRS
ncbi:Imm72 family immunity protein [Paraburkholderia aspalathi]|uniref:Imm72 family immunity protein n=1 Tax=Paraburkholderia aspalathi TaxID=1324617 RepID=UPI0038BCFCD1